MVHMYESYSMIQAERSQKEYRERFKIWKEHKDFIESKDSENLGFAMNLNQFAHLSPREWYGTDFLLADAPQVRDPYCSDQTSAKYVFQISSCHDSSFTKNNSAPDNIDWRETGAVLPVINQGSLGKSAYFATTDTVASIWYRKTGHLVPLSVQQLSDCSKNYFDLYQFNYIIDAKGYYDANMIIF